MVAAGVATALAGSATGAPTWTSPQPLSVPGIDALTPQVLMGPTGGVMAVWARSGGSYTIQSTTKSGDGPEWSAVQDVSTVGLEATQPRLTTDPVGNVLAIYRASNGTTTIVRSTYRAAGATVWENPQSLPNALPNAAEPQVGFDEAGGALAVWRRFDGFNFVVQTATRASGLRTAWSEPTDLSFTGRDATDPQLAVAPNGNAVAVWVRPNDANVPVVFAAERVDGVWTAAVPLSSPTAVAAEPRVVITATQVATVVWRADGRIQSASRSATPGDWSPAGDVSPDGVVADELRLALDSGGAALAAWRATAGGTSRIQAAARPPGGGWSPAVDLSSGPAASQPAIAVDRAGNAGAAWRAASTGSGVIQVALRAGGLWGAPTDVSPVPGGDSPHLAFDSVGNGAVVWSEPAGTYIRVQAAGYDAAGPVLAGVVIPPEVNAGERAEMFATAFDVWSGPATLPAWSFSDGRAASGTSITPVFRKAGTVLVTVKSQDTLGNVSTVERPVTVLPLTLKRVRATCVRPKAAGPCRISLRYRLSFAATVRVSVTTAAGKPVGVYQRKASGGDVTQLLPAKIGKGRLAEGRYRLTVSANVGGVATRRVTVPVVVA